MGIRQLSLTDFRNIRSTTLDFNPSMNLFFGRNGSGKTSLLAAVHVICQACSFRTHQLKKCVFHGKEGFLLFAKFDNHKAGLSKNNKKLEIRVDGEGIKRRSELVRLTPINIFNSASFDLLEGSPQKRRQFIDWCLFHVEHSYAENWLLFNHALKQRNSLLKSRRNLELLDYWDDYIQKPALAISQLRESYSQKISALMETQLGDITGDLSFSMQYRKGWAADSDLITAMQSNRSRDIKAGFTQAGIHRDDISFSAGDKPANEVLSRGQSKRICLSLLLSSLMLVNKGTGKRIVLLIDDLNSELDQQGQDDVYQRLQKMDLQLFVSNINEHVPAPMKGKDFKMFHVEHGMIKPRKFS